MATQDEVAGVVDQLRAVLALVESGELEAGPDQHAWLRGVVDGLQVVMDEGVSLPRM
jgi:hypothetical protein